MSCDLTVEHESAPKATIASSSCPVTYPEGGRTLRLSEQIRSPGGCQRRARSTEMHLNRKVWPALSQLLTAFAVPIGGSMQIP